MKYREPEPITEAEAEAAFQRKNSQEISEVLVSLAFYDPNWRWVESYCLEYLEDHDPELRRVAATCLGHLARIHKTIDTDIVIPALKSHLTDPEPYVAGTMEDALDDIDMFVKEPSSMIEYLHSDEYKNSLSDDGSSS
jgi:hypothetical protein